MGSGLKSALRTPVVPHSSGQHENVEAAVVACSTLNPKIAKYCEMTVKTCAYAGSGDLVQIKELMKQLVEKVCAHTKHGTSCILISELGEC